MSDEQESVEYWSISLDDFVIEAHDFMARDQDGGAGHYARYTGNKHECIEKAMKSIKKLVEKMIYESDDYGYEKP